MNVGQRYPKALPGMGCILLACAGLVSAQAQNRLPKVGERKFSTPALSRARDAYLVSTLTARNSYVAELDAALKNAMTAHDLDEANAINAVKTAITTGAAPPPNAFKSPKAKAAGMVYASATAKAEAQYAAALDSALKTALSGGNLNEANAIQGELKAIRKAPDQGQTNESSDLAISGTGFIMDTLQNGTPAFSNRAYPWAKIPTSLRGWRYAKVPIRTAVPQIIVRAKKKTVLQAIGAVDELPAKLPAGWERAGTQFTVDDPARAKNPPQVHLFRRAMEAGEEVEMPKGNVWGMLPLLPNE